jgi:allantoin racemase
MPKILVINPVSTSMWDESDREYMSRCLSAGFELEVRSLEYGSPSLETYFDEAISMPFILKEISRLEGYDGIIINCFLNPAVDAARELVDVPVVGAGEAALYVACMSGRAPSIIGVGGSTAKSRYEEVIRSLRLSNRVVSIRCVGLAVLELDKDRGRTYEMLLRSAREAVCKDGADVLILGCTGLVGYAEELSSELNVPVVDPALASVKVMELLISLGLRHSKTARPYPPRKERAFPPSLRELSRYG